MAFSPESLSLLVQPIGDVGLRIYSYRTDDTEATVTGAAYATNAAYYGLRVADLVIVTPVTLPGADPYIMSVGTVDVDGNATLSSPGPLGDLLAANNLSDVADAATALTNLGGVSKTADETITGVKTFSTTASSTTPVRLESSDAGAIGGPQLDLARTSASPAANDVIGIIRFRGMDSAATETSYGNINATILDPTDGSEDGRLILQVPVAGAQTAAVSVANGVIVGAPTGSYQGTGTINSTGYYVNGVAVASIAGNTFTGVQLVPDGSVSAPALAFSGDTDTGFYRIGANEVGVAAGGTLMQRTSSTRTIMPLAQSNGARLEIQKHSSPAGYSTIRGAMVVQAEQLVDQASSGVFSEGLLVTLDKDFDGPVTLGPPSSSQSVSPPMRVVVTNTGDGSLPSYHGTTSVYAVGATGYNEGGGYSQTVQNVASTNCILSGVEVLLRDSIDAGVTDFDTEMHVLVPRIARFNNGSESVAFIYCSAEGSVPADAIMKLNPNSLASVGAGLDLREWSFTTGQVMQFPNDTAIAWENSTGTLVECINLSNANQLILKPAGTGSSIALQGGSATTKLLVSETGLGFFGTAPVARPTGVAVTAAGIHAALVTLGLITA